MLVLVSTSGHLSLCCCLFWGKVLSSGCPEATPWGKQEQNLKTFHLVTGVSSCLLLWSGATWHLQYQPSSGSGLFLCPSLIQVPSTGNLFSCSSTAGSEEFSQEPLIIDRLASFLFLTFLSAAESLLSVLE